MDGSKQRIAGVSVSHKNATTDQIRKAKVHSTEFLLADPSVKEAFQLETCNRAEAYVVTDKPQSAQNGLTVFTSHIDSSAVRLMGHEESVRHLMRVSCGLESIVIGEEQVLGQLQSAHEASSTTGSVLDNALTKAIHVGQRARQETSINDGVTSLGGASSRLVQEKIDTPKVTALVVGAGEMGTIVSKRLSDHVEKLIVVNRTLERAESLVDDLSTTTEVCPLDAIPSILSSVDVVISATGSTTEIVESDVFQDCGETLVIDLANPRDIPRGIKDYEPITLYDLDHMESVTEKTTQMRKESINNVEGIISEECDNLETQYKRQRADDVVSSVHRNASQIKREEIDVALSKLDLDAEDEEIVESMADTIVSRLLADPTDGIRDAAESGETKTIQTVEELFDVKSRT